MQPSQSNAGHNKRIAKNTMLLSVRMIILMVVNLYISRIVLEALGEEDYGIYTTVAGFVTFASILSGSVSNSISRYLTIYLEKGNLQDLKRVFATSISIQLVLSLMILVMFELLGVWYVYGKLNCPPDRVDAAMAVLQFSLFTFIVNLLSASYNATIIAHERMNAFAYISIVEALLKLGIAFSIVSFSKDKLILFAGLMFLSAVVVRLIYSIYCKRHFEECRYEFGCDKKLFKKMFSFAGWNFIGTGSYVLMTQGVNILMNFFFGLPINAARGVVMKVEATINQFINNFTTAVNPQIIKSYSRHDVGYMHDLVCLSSKYSYFILWAISLPLLMESEFIINLWLKVPPPQTVVFFRWMICLSLLSVISNPLITSFYATGNIKRYQIVVGGLGLLVFPLAWGAFALGYPPYFAYAIQFGVFLLQLLSRLLLLRRMISFSIRNFIFETLLKDLVVTIISIVLPLIVVLFFAPSLERFILSVLVSMVAVGSAIYLLGFSKREKSAIMRYTRDFRKSKFYHNR